MSKAARLAIGFSLVGSLFPALSSAQQTQSFAVPDLPTLEFSRVPILDRDEGLKIAGLVLLAATLDGTVQRRSQAMRGSGSNRVAEWGNAAGHLRYMGPVLAAGWAVGQIGGRSQLSRATAQATSSGLIAGGIVTVLKRGFGRLRPRDGSSEHFAPFSDHSAFPSGHTTLAVAIATSLAHSTENKTVDAMLYGTAALTGFARINDNKHWFSDVVAGAALGYLVGRQVNAGLKDTRPLIGPGLAGLSISF